MRGNIVNGRVVSDRIIQQSQSIGHNLSGNRELSDINHITVHHSVSGQNPSIDAINNWWTAPPRNWTTPAYHFIIRGDGQIWQLAPITRSLGGTLIASVNSRTVHITFAGNFAEGDAGFNGPTTAAARDSFRYLCRLLFGSAQLNNLHNQDANIQGHREVQSTLCPGFSRQQYLSWR